MTDSQLEVRKGRAVNGALVISKLEDAIVRLNLITLCAYCHLDEHGQLYFEPQAIKITAKPKGWAPGSER